jgi:protein tyrosine phosphatase (PTP) superfamily phosphohydrolase (DUF442 family)
MLVLLCVPLLHAQEAGFERLSSQHLPNAIRVHAKVISGGLPADQRAFQELQEMGVKTIISVDGAMPDVELATQFGMRYIHLPHGYDGISAERVKELAKAIRELEGPIYIHCHHGRHRSPAAAATACVTAGFIEPHSGVALLRFAGTSPNYRGLFRAAEQARLLPAAELDSLRVEFKERAEVPSLATAMVALEHTFDNLRKLSANGWKQSNTPPDIDAAHEALLLREHFAELLRTDNTRQREENYQQLLNDAEQLAEQLEKSLTISKSARLRNPEGLSTLMKRLEDNCRSCHTRFRDGPQE